MNTSNQVFLGVVRSSGKPLVPIALLATLTFLSAPLMRGATVMTCDEPGLNSALTNALNDLSGVVTFACSGTITLTRTIVISTHVPFTIDGSGQNVIISGGFNVSVFGVPSGATLTLSNLQIARGKAALEGGGVLNQNMGTLTVEHCRFAGNTATGNLASPGLGGAIANHGTLMVSDSTFAGNGVIIGDGGAIGSDGPLVTVTNTTFALPELIGGNSARNGGAIFNVNGVLQVDHSFFGLGNVASANGGAIYNEVGGTFMLQYSAFIGNSALGAGGATGGGGALVNLGKGTVSNSLFSNNTSLFLGAIFNGFGSLTVTNSTFAGNTGGVSNNSSGSLTVDYSTFFGNSGGNYVQTDQSPTTIKDTILASGGSINCGGAIVDGGYNLADDNSCKFAPNSTSLSTPILDLGPLTNNGGPTLTIEPNFDSPALNKIPPGVNGCGTSVTTDQRGVARPQQANCDIGAVEAVPGAPVSPQLCNGTFTGAFAGDLIVSTGQVCTFLGGSITGNIQLQGGTLTLSYVTVGGSIEATGGAFAIGPSTTINGNVKIHDYPPTPAAPNKVCGTSIKSNLQIYDNAAAVAIGANPLAVCAGNTIGGDLEVHDNAAPTQILDNTVTGNLEVHDNTAPTQVIGNTVTGVLTCHDNSSIQGGPNLGSVNVQGQCYQVIPR